MNAVMAQALAPFAPPASAVHKITEAERLKTDMQRIADYKSGETHRRLVSRLVNEQARREMMTRQAL
jgi:hypothetical protein